MQRRTFLQFAAANAALIVLPSTTTYGKSLSWANYNKAIVIDGLSGIFSGKTETLTASQLATIKNSGITAINATVPYPGMNFEQTKKRIELTKRVVSKYPSALSLITSTDDILVAKKEKQVGVILGFQSTEMFADDLTRIKYFADNGVRYMQMTYNNKSQFGDGGLVKRNNGLTTLGINALAEIEANKVLVDLSHSGQQTVADAVAASTRPLTISHTGCNSIYRHPRNNDDQELRAVANKGGVVGIYLMPFLEGGNGVITAESVMKHLDYAINLCGEDHVAIGSDQGVIPVKDGPKYREMIRKDVEIRMAKGISAPGETPNRPPFVPELNSERRMELIAFHMQKRGHSSSTIEKVLGLNLFNLYKQVW
ncbi:dipeptidase [Thalassotalea atypica]|uniref:dipeptidase n=1 Tax=Thalassotalea atypica TaxID=2054316 RepID=UPI0025730769|nr:membrane dipeptidase [Thalassotalea atypica]